MIEVFSCKVEVFASCLTDKKLIFDPSVIFFNLSALVSTSEFCFDSFRLFPIGGNTRSWIMLLEVSYEMRGSSLEWGL